MTKKTLYIASAAITAASIAAIVTYSIKKATKKPVSAGLLILGSLGIAAGAALSTKPSRDAVKELGNEPIRYKKIKKNYVEIVRSFAAIQMKKEPRVKVGVVGEIFVKYSPLGNNDLERFLVSEGAEVVVPGLYDFCLFFVYNYMMEPKLYKKKEYLYPLWKLLFRFLCNKKEDLSRAIRENSDFETPTPFEQVTHMAKDLISHAVKMGEGWLLTAEMVELADSGCGNIVCTQPFGCLPNHICGKGMMKPLKELKPDVNIVAIDYDAGASRVNQENRLKLMLANAKKIMAQSGKEADT